MQRERGRDTGRGRSVREPDVGLDPESSGSWPGLKLALNCWATRATLNGFIVVIF